MYPLNIYDFICQLYLSKAEVLKIFFNGDANNAYHTGVSGLNENDLPPNKIGFLLLLTPCESHQRRLFLLGMPHTGRGGRGAPVPGVSWRGQVSSRGFPWLGGNAGPRVNLVPGLGPLISSPSTRGQCRLRESQP